MLEGKPTVLSEIDKFLYKADNVLKEAKNLKASNQCDLCVRRAREAFELYLETIFHYIGEEYPKSHDVEQQIYEISNLLKQYYVEPKSVAQIVLRNQVLNLWREPRFYGDEKLGASKIFTENEAKLALLYAEELGSICKRIQYYEYKATKTWPIYDKVYT
jgi:HEPN domain-containing protein